jgi:hypothetical protein
VDPEILDTAFPGTRPLAASCGTTIEVFDRWDLDCRSATMIAKALCCDSDKNPSGS